MASSTIGSSVIRGWRCTLTYMWEGHVKGVFWWLAAVTQRYLSRCGKMVGGEVNSNGHHSSARAISHCKLRFYVMKREDTLFAGNLSRC